jgi:hypothetical protein
LGGVGEGLVLNLLLQIWNPTLEMIVSLCRGCNQFKKASMHDAAHHLLIQPSYLQLHKYELVPNNLTIRYFRFLELFVTNMRMWFYLNQMCLLLLGMMDLAWMRRTNIRAWSCMQIATSMWGLKRALQVNILELWSLHNVEWQLGWIIQDYTS